MATVTLVPGINAVNLGDRVFAPCQSGTPADGQDHFEHTQLDGSQATLCLDKTATLMQKRGAQSPQHWWFLAHSEPFKDLAPLIADATVSVESRLDAIIGTIGKGYGYAYYNNVYIMTDEDKKTVSQFAESILNDPKLGERAAGVICAFADTPSIHRLQDRLATIMRETQNPELRDSVAKRLCDVKTVTSTRLALFAVIAQHLDMRPAAATPALDLPNEGPYDLDPPAATSVHGLYQAVRDRIDAVQRENPVHCVGAKFGGGCSWPQFPEMQWYEAFMATSQIPVEELNPEQRQLTLQCLREMMIRGFEYDYGMSNDTLRDLYRRFIQIDREEAISFAELVQNPSSAMAEAVLSEYRNRPAWDDLKCREGKLLIGWATEAIVQEGTSYTHNRLKYFDADEVRDMIARDPDPSFKDDVQKSAERFIEYYEYVYRFSSNDDARDLQIQKIEEWRDGIFAKLDGKS